MASVSQVLLAHVLGKQTHAARRPTPHHLHHTSFNARLSRHTSLLSARSKASATARAPFGFPWQMRSAQHAKADDEAGCLSPSTSKLISWAPLFPDV